MPGNKKVFKRTDYTATGVVFSLKRGPNFARAVLELRKIAPDLDCFCTVSPIGIFPATIKSRLQYDVQPAYISMCMLH